MSFGSAPGNARSRRRNGCFSAPPRRLPRRARSAPLRPLRLLAGRLRLLTRGGLFSPSLDGGLPLFELFNPRRRSSSATCAFSAAISALCAITSAISSSRDGSAAESGFIESLNRETRFRCPEDSTRLTSQIPQPNPGSYPINKDISRVRFHLPLVAE
jgi:hypothetical protein